YRQAAYYDLVKGDLEREHDSEHSASVYRRALQAIQRGISIDQTSRSSYLARAEFKASTPRFTTLREGDSKAYLLLSLVYERLGNLEEAHRAINRARELDPLNPQMYSQLSSVLAQQGRNDEADLAMMQANAITSLQEGNWQNAADASGRALQVDSAEYPSAFYLNAMANLRLGNLGVAEKSARQAMVLDTAHRNPRIGYVLGLVLAQKQEYTRAVDLLNEYLREMPEAPDSGTVRKQIRDIENSAQTGAIPRGRP
ncbi:MAG: tetratricopeptide repeat protein, partial [Acidobacteriota bacterium]